MANREALRELQTRLASRLQSAKAEGMSTAWLAVKAGGLNYLFPLTQSGEIFPMTTIQPVPYVQPWFLGVLNLRGGLFGVVDLAAFLTAEGAPVRSERLLAESSVVTLHAALEVNCALLIDDLAGLRHVEAFTASEASADGAPAYFGPRYTDKEGQSWQEINLQLMSQSAQFLSISA